MTSSQIEMIAPGDLRPWARNARTHSRKQIRQIADSIRTFGFTNPVLIDEDNTILAGHGRVAVARELGMESVPCRLISAMTPETFGHVPAEDGGMKSTSPGVTSWILRVDFGRPISTSGDTKPGRYATR